ncbi:MAG: radical SAM/SPASM domain-containing protein [Gammaproteobacteria bacterium]|nr:MAG: radical SAM/SPASM domain-containing protein [Gammaproteobacteria bacterium]
MMHVSRCMVSFMIKAQPVFERHFDFEFTNRCNATCSFCPRDTMPKMGMMTKEVFLKTLDRCRELPLGQEPILKACGTGEPLINPQAVDFIEHACGEGFVFNLTTNASLLTGDKAQRLFAAGLNQLNLSISATGELYRAIYNLDFNLIDRNVKDMLSLDRGACKVQVTIVDFEDNHEKVPEIRDYWKRLGINRVSVVSTQNRGGHLKQFSQHAFKKDYEEEAWQIIHENGMSHHCFSPYLHVFIGWNGNYYLCCHDWTKKFPVGSVFDLSVSEVDLLKMKLTESREGCKLCTFDIVNQLREKLIAVNDQGEDPSVLDDKIAAIKPLQTAMKEVIGVMQTDGVLKLPSSVKPD